MLPLSYRSAKIRREGREDEADTLLGRSSIGGGGIAGSLRQRTRPYVYHGARNSHLNGGAHQHANAGTHSHAEDGNDDIAHEYPRAYDGSYSGSTANSGPHSHAYP